MRIAMIHASLSILAEDFFSRGTINPLMPNGHFYGFLWADPSLIACVSALFFHYNFL